MPWNPWRERHVGEKNVMPFGEICKCSVKKGPGCSAWLWGWEDIEYFGTKKRCHQPYLSNEALMWRVNSGRLEMAAEHLATDIVVLNKGRSMQSREGNLPWGL